MCLLFISLLFGCGGGGGNTQNSNTTTANAGPDQSVIAGSVVTLDGSQSTGANNSLITYQWSMVFIPNGSSAFLSSATVVNPTFTADVAGSYVLNLVVNDGMVNSAPSTVTITASVANAAPVANAGIAQSVTTGAVVTLNGSDSSDANGDPLTYAWAFTSKPAGSSAVLSSATVVNPTFTADVAGPYVLNLVVNDGMVNSAPSTVTITASVANAAPVANAGIAQSVTTGAVVTLNGSGSSDANGDPLTYVWAFTSKPAGSSAVLSSATVVNPTFTADLAGPYVLNLVVNDGMVNSTPSTVTITASAPNYVGSYSGTYQYDNTALTGGTLDIVIAGYSTTTLTGTIDTHKGDGPIAFSSGSITGDIFQASIEGIFNDTTIDGTFTPDGLTLSGTFQNSNPSEENGTLTVTKQ
jgi:F0F1-type ATP synthase epsilon subunit